jgi:hypothetical protein
MIARGPARLVRQWVRLYTRGVRPESRDRRRDEIDADLWCQLEESALLGRPAGSTDIEILIRWLAGIPADLIWRIEHRGGGVMARLAGASRGGTIGALLIVGGLALVGLLWRYAAYTTDDRLIWVGSAGNLAIAAALAGMVVRFHDELDSRIVVVGWLGALAAALTSVLYFVMFVLPFATVPLVLNLARARVFGRWLAAVHAGAGGVYVVGILIGLSGGRGDLLGFAIMSYDVSLILLGLSLVAGALRSRPAAAAA